MQSGNYGRSSDCYLGFVPLAFMQDGSQLIFLFPLEDACFSDLLSLRKNREDQSQTGGGKAVWLVPGVGHMFHLPNH